MRHSKKLLLHGLALLCGAALLALVSVVVAQDDALPPQVVEVRPYPGEEVPTDQAVTVTFDQPMDAASVEAAWSVDPATPGTFSWPDERTVSFLPDGGWPRATRTDITIGTGAKAATGVTLVESYSFFVQSVGFLQVAAVVPSTDAEGVAADATITVSFNRPVVPLVSTEQLDDLPQPLVIEPAVEGKGEWLNTSIYMFTPTQALSGGTTYIVTVPAGLTDVTGGVLAESYLWTFKTLPPEILNVYPYQGAAGVPLEQVISVQFSQPMDRPSTEEAFMLIYGGERVAGTLAWSDEDRVLTFTPTERLKMESVYALTIAPNARSASGEATLRDGVNYSFTTVPYPGIASTIPGNGAQDVYPGSGVSFFFKSPMNTETFKDKVVFISPENVEFTPVVYGSDSFGLDFATLPETMYVIVFKAGAEDVYGNKIETDYTLSFNTGKIEPAAWMVNSDQFNITNAYREDTRIAMGVQAKPTVDFELYRVPVENVGLAIRLYSEHYDRLTNKDTLQRDWSQTMDSGPAQRGVDEVLLASEEGGQLSPGVYLLQAYTPGSNRYAQAMSLGVVTANLTVKREPDQMLVWATDMQSGAPVANTMVSVYQGEGALLAGGLTDSDGVYRAPVDLDYTDEFVYVVAESDGVYGVWASWYEPSAPNMATYLYTDRPIYRPGQTVYYRGVLRNRDDMTYTIPQGIETVHVAVDVNWGSQILFEGDLPVSEFGTFDGKIDLPEDAQIGQGIIHVTYGPSYMTESYFSVAEFRVPEYKLEVTPDFTEIIQDDPLKAVAAASYYFGGGVGNADVSWYAYGDIAYFNYTGPGRYTFTDSDQDYFYGVTLANGQDKTDASGRVVMDIANTKAPSTRPLSIMLEASVVDESGQYIAGRTSVIAHPANVYVGLATDRYFGREKTPVNVNVIAVTPQSEPVAGQKVELTVIEIRWERIAIEGQFGQYDWQQKEIEVEKTEVTTGDDGTVRYTFTPPQAGIYRVRALVRDERERVNLSSLRLWVTGEASVWWGRPSDQVDLMADKDSYKPGDTAEILVPTPFSGTSYALVTVERLGVQEYHVFKIEGSTLLYELPITEAHVPTIHVSVVLIKGMDEESLNPQYRTGTLSLDVEPVNQRLSVTVTPSTTLTQPGDTVTFDIKTVDSRGEPVSAEVGVTLTDLAILSLAPPNSRTLEETFYGYQGNYVDTEVALSRLIDVVSDEVLKNFERREAANAPAAMQGTALPTQTATVMGMVADEAVSEAGGGAATTEVTIREDFQQTPLWAPRVITDVSGHATVEVTLPDNLTTWHLDARGLTTDTRVGDAALDIMSTLPLLTRPVVPRFFVVGDRATLASVINNNTDEPQDVQATLEAEGVILESDATQTVTIEAGGRARVEWNVVIEDVPYVDLTFFAIGKDGYQDAVKPTLATGPDGTIPVYRYTAPDTVGTGGVLREQGSLTEAISLPPSLDVDQGELTVHIDPSLAVTTVDALDYLINFEHQCIEQTVSRFLPNVMTYRALKNLGVEDPELEKNLLTVLDYALNRLSREQNVDGGWGWFGLMESSPYVTAYAVLGLVEARDAGFQVDAGMLDRALNFVRGYFIRPGIDTPTWELNRQAFYLYVFARAGQVGQADLDALLAYRLEMDYWAQAFLLMAYHQFNPADPAVPQLISDLQTGAILSATGGHWEEKEMDWWNWSSDTRTTAIALAALTRTQPDNALLPNVVRWLMVARQGDHWVTTQETSWAVMALTDWMVATGELKGNYDYALTLNGDALTEGTVTPDTVRQGEVLHVQVKDLLLDEANRLTFIRGEGEGVLYYTAHLKTRLWASEAKPISRGISVSREYFGADGQPTTKAKAGDVITVRVTMTLPQDIYYFVLEDPIPAGTEPVDTSLLTTAREIEGPMVRPAYDPRWWWGWWLFDHTEMRDEKVNLYADFLPTGTYVYSYQVRATFPGEYQTMPSHAYAFYFPEVFGRGAGTLFTVEPEN